MLSKRVLAVVMLVVLAFSTGSALALDVVVGDGSGASCTEAALNSAVASLNTASGGTLTFNCGGAVTIPLTTQKRFTQTGTYVIDGGGMVTLDGNNVTRILYTASGKNINFTVRNITLTRGRAAFDAAGERAANQGGAIYSGYDNILTVENVTFTNNFAKGERHPYHGGGAIAIDATNTVTITGSTFTGNTSPNGGAINNLLSRLTIESSTFRQNSATRADPGGGGAIYNDAGRLTIRNSVIMENTSANLGGGIFTWAHNVVPYSGKTVLFNSVIARNTANDLGGGVWKGGAYLMEVTRSTIAENVTKSAGGGLAGTGPGANFKVINSTISGNRVQRSNGGSGAGIFSGGSSSTIVNSTIAYNTVPNADQAVAAAIHGNAALKNTVIAYNTGGWNGVWACMGNITNNGGNVQFPNNDCGNKIPKRDPNLAPLSPALENVVVGGAAPTHALTVPSFAINRAVDCVAIDQRGVARPQGDKCDSGAFELEGTAPLPVTLVSPPNKGTIPHAKPVNLTLSWNASFGAVNYRVVILRPDGAELHNVLVPAEQAQCADGVSTCTYSVQLGMAVNKVFKWSVRAINPFGTKLSPTWTFKPVP